MPVARLTKVEDLYKCMNWTQTIFIYLMIIWATDEITCSGKMPSPNVGGPLSVLQVLNMDYGVWVSGGSLSAMKAPWAASKFEATSYYSVHPLIFCRLLILVKHDATCGFLVFNSTRISSACLAVENGLQLINNKPQATSCEQLLLNIVRDFAHDSWSLFQFMTTNLILEWIYKQYFTNLNCGRLLSCLEGFPIWLPFGDIICYCIQ